MTLINEIVTVTEADREAAARYLRAIPGFPEVEVERFLEGAFDHLDDALPQAFARHRLAAERETVERCVRLADQRVTVALAAAPQAALAVFIALPDAIRALASEQPDNG